MICLSKATIAFLLLNCHLDSGEGLIRDHVVNGGGGCLPGKAPVLPAHSLFPCRGQTSRLAGVVRVRVDH